ncbi:Uncharacterised protein [uncultured archaeon]|nr:Uncharacterised protein [uncultured archaeon]
MLEKTSVPNKTICQEIKEAFKPEMDFMIDNPAIEMIFPVSYLPRMSRKEPRRMIAGDIESGNKNSATFLNRLDPFPEDTTPIAIVHTHPATDMPFDLPSQADINTAFTKEVPYICVVQVAPKKLLCVNVKDTPAYKILGTEDFPHDVFKDSQTWDKAQKEKLQGISHCEVDI